MLKLKGPKKRLKTLPSDHVSNLPAGKKHLPCTMSEIKVVFLRGFTKYLYIIVNTI